MLIIGLTGGSGAGKSVVARAFREHNFTSIDTDAVYHEITSTKGSPCLIALSAEFGEGILSPDGVLDRRALSQIVFAEGNQGKLQRLNKITHTFVLDEVRRRFPEIEADGYLGVLVDAPLLFESGFHLECDIILCVISEKDTRIRRITERDGITREMAERRIASQLSDEILTERSDFTIINNGEPQELSRQVEKIVRIIKNKF